jgi:hypothetical protein
VLVLALLSAVLAAGCGRKLPPIQPGSYPPPAVRNLSGAVLGVEAVLTWTVPPGDPDKDTPAVAFRVLRSRQTAEEVECATCPPVFSVIGELRPSQATAGAPLQYTDRLEPGYRYQYKVRTISSLGREGRDSNVVHLDS